MKRAAVVIAVLGMCVCGWAQNKPAGQSAPAGQATAAAPQGKRPPQAKTQPEFEAYKAAIALTDAAAVEKAADDFATKFPDSELRVVLYKDAMQKYQMANNADKMEAMARKALTLDPDDPEALVGVAQVLAETTHDTDLDKDQKIDEAKKDAERALATVDTDVPTAGYPPEKIDQFKRYIKSEAYAILGTLNLAAVCHRPTRELAYGQQRLLEIALALAARPKVLLLDEPAAGVPRDESNELFAAIAGLSRDITVLFIEHDMELVFRFASRVIVMVGGRVLTEGTPAEIAADERVRAVYLGERHRGAGR